MSYDLYFWRQTEEMKKSPKEILHILTEDGPVEGIVPIPRRQVRRVLKESFPDIQDGDFQFDWEGAGSYFQIEFTHANERDVNLIIVTCGYDLFKSEEVVNRIIECFNGLGCALYDPQDGKRYEQPEPRQQE